MYVLTQNIKLTVSHYLIYYYFQNKSKTKINKKVRKVFYFGLKSLFLSLCYVCVLPFRFQRLFLFLPSVINLYSLLEEKLVVKYHYNCNNNKTSGKIKEKEKNWIVYFIITKCTEKLKYTHTHVSSNECINFIPFLLGIFYSINQCE